MNVITEPHPHDKQNQAKNRKMTRRFQRGGLAAKQFARQRDCQWMRRRGHGTPKKKAEVAQ